MNRFFGQISEARELEALRVLNVKCGELDFIVWLVARSADSAADFESGAPVEVFFKETEIDVGTGRADQWSAENRFSARLLEIENGEYFARLSLLCGAGHLDAIVTVERARELDLRPGAELSLNLRAANISLARAEEAGRVD